MSLSKRAWEEENADSDPFARCAICGEFTDECICGDVATETGRVFYPGEEATLAESIDAHVTRTPAHPLDGDRIAEAYFGPWAEAMVKAEVSRGQLEGMWDRIKTKLDDLGKVEQLIGDVFGHRARMVP